MCQDPENPAKGARLLPDLNRLAIIRFGVLLSVSYTQISPLPLI